MTISKNKKNIEYVFYGNKEISEINKGSKLLFENTHFIDFIFRKFENGILSASKMPLKRN